MSDNTFRTEFRVNCATFHQLHDALQLPPMIRTAHRWASDSRDALLILLRRLGESSRQSTVADFSGRDRSAISRIVKLTCCMITARWFAAPLLDPHRIAPQHLVLYAHVIVSHGSPLPKLVWFLNGSRYSISDHHGKSVQNASSRIWRTKESSVQMELFWTSRDRLRARMPTEASSSNPRCKHVLLQSYLTIIFSLTLRTLCLFKFLQVSRRQRSCMRLLTIFLWLESVL
jgi:hypothetical protein